MQEQKEAGDAVSRNYFQTVFTVETREEGGGNKKYQAIEVTGVR
jgi:hypothetical protein